MQAQSSASSTSSVHIQRTSSLETAVERLGSMPVESWDIVSQLLTLHSEYAGGRAVDLLKTSKRPEPGAKLPAAEWLNKLPNLIHGKDVNGVDLYDGRLAILGLALADPNLHEFLQATDVLPALKAEISPPYRQLLTAEGTKADKGETDAVRIFDDNPVSDGRDDWLRRRSLARVLARILREIRESRGCTSAFLVHLHGAWGSGKTTVLRFMKEQLQQSHKQPVPVSANAPTTRVAQEWIAIDFNAWQHQRLRPAWWPLLDTILRQGRSELWRAGRWGQAAKLTMCEYLWRTMTGRAHLALAFAVFALAAFVIGHTGWSAKLWSSSSAPKFLLDVIALAGAIWSGAMVLSRSLLIGSTKDARSFLESGNDPLRQLERHFDRQLKAFHRPVIVMIDDLDRCESSFTVELLEGMQTLMRTAPVMYVVAADRRWLRSCFEDNYRTFKEYVGEAARPLGLLFLEKTFQLSVSVPPPSPDIRSAYWDHLISNGSEEKHELAKEAVDQAQRALASATSEDEVLKVLDAVPVEFRTVVQDTAFDRLASPEVLAHTEHRLKRFTDLLEPNPRAMKRLINAYYIQRAVNVLNEGKVDRDRLALWTIVLMRWPLLGEYLERCPEDAEKVSRGDTSATIYKQFPDLVSDADFVRMVKGDRLPCALDAETIRMAAGLRVLPTHGPPPRTQSAVA